MHIHAFSTAGAGPLRTGHERNDRITDLEMLAAHQAQTIEDLSAMVAEQWKVIDAMRRRLE